MTYTIRVLAALAAPVLAGVVVAAGPPADLLAQRLRDSPHTIIGTVVETQARRVRTPFGDEIILTRAMIRVSETLKGPRVAWVPLEVEGGTVDGITMGVSDLPLLTKGERAVFLVEAAEPGRYLPHGRGAGILKLDDDDRIEGLGIGLAELRSIARGVR